MAARRDFGLSGRQVVAFGGPREDQTDDHGQVHSPMHHDLSVGTQGRGDAYIGSPWLQYSFAAVGVQRTPHRNGIAHRRPT
ncbi:MAG: hypothetical protein ACJAYI_001486 [Myxococcota bacterium]|jgi:hypothetical protein